jgi:hypothetical protein
MTTITKIVSALAAVAVSASVFAQTQPENPNYSSSGLLGQRYVDYGFGLIDVNKSRTDLYGTGLTVNVPVVSNIDIAVNYSYSWVEADHNDNANELSLDAIYYIEAGKVKPFGGVTYGYHWNDWFDDDFVGAFGGLEFQVLPQLVLSGRAGYSAWTDDVDEGAWDGTVEARYFFTKTVAASASVTLFEGGDVGYTAGVTLKF